MSKSVNRCKLPALLVLVCINLFSCGYTKEHTAKYLPGHYFYEIPSGEIQELTINPDFTIKQIIYSNDKKEILYENTGKMSVDGREIDFLHWLECYEPVDPKMLMQPRLTNFTGIVWRKPKGTEGVQIIMFDQNGYIFRKVSSENSDTQIQTKKIIHSN